MLLVHPDSSCDICLEAYNPTRTPHAIACGHIFCIGCLTKCNPHICPICRKKYQLDRAKKLHVESVSSAGSGNASQTEFAEKLMMVVMVSGEETSEYDFNSVTGQVDEWLRNQSPQHMHIRPLRMALEYVFKAREMRADFQEAVENSQSLERRLDRLEEDLRTARLVETSLLEQNEETKRELDALQLMYNHVSGDPSSSHSRSSVDSPKEPSSRKSDEIKASHWIKRPLEGVYSITPGAPHSERVLPQLQHRQSHSASSSGSDHRRKDKGRSTDTVDPNFTNGLGLYDHPHPEVNGVDNIARTATRESVELDSSQNSSQSWNGGNALGMDINPQADYHNGGGDDNWPRSHSHSRSADYVPPRHASFGDSFEHLSILSPPASNGQTDHRGNHGVGSVRRSQSPVDVPSPQSTTSWGTTILSANTSRSSLSVGDMRLNGLPAVPSRSSLDLGLSALDDFQMVDHDSDDDADDLMTPGRSDLVRDRHLYDRQPVAGAAGFTPRFTETAQLHNTRPNQLRRASIATPRGIGRSVSDTTGARQVESGLDGDELEIVGMRFSQSFSEIEPALSGLGSTIDEPPSAGRGHRRRASMSTASTVVPLDDPDTEDDVELGRGIGPLSADTLWSSRSVSFSTPKPGSGSSKSQRFSRNQGLAHHLSLSGHGKRPQTPKTVPATPYVNTARVEAFSSAVINGTHPEHRGAATVSALPRPLPPYDPTYTNVAPSNGRSLPSSHYSTPYVAPRTFQQNTRSSNGSASQSSYTLQPSASQSPLEPSAQPEQTVQAQVPILHAPQPVSGKSHIGRPWKHWES